VLVGVAAAALDLVAAVAADFINISFDPAFDAHEDLTVVT